MLNEKKRLFQTILIVIGFITTLAIIFGLCFFKKDQKKQDIPKNPQIVSPKKEYSIPDVTEENTIFNISSFEEVESLIIKIDNKLNEYNLYYLIENMDEVVEKEKINIEDYSNYSLYEEEINLENNSNIYFVYEKNNEYSKNKYVLKIENIVKRLQETEEVSEEQLEKENISEEEKKVSGTAPYYIRVNYGANTVTIYSKDENGDYTVPVKAMVCSCGRATPKGGTYKTTRGYAWGSLIGGVYGQYSTRIVGSILFHSVPYTNRSKDSLEYWEYDKLGTTASAGCVRLTVEDAKWIFNNCGAGVMVEFYSDGNPGPLGKPSAQKISGNIECRDWDPTDYVPENPWLGNSSEENQNNDIAENVEENDNSDKLVENTSLKSDDDKVINNQNKIDNNKSNNTNANKSKINNTNTNNSKINNTNTNNSNIKNTNNSNTQNQKNMTTQNTNISNTTSEKNKNENQNTTNSQSEQNIIQDSNKDLDKNEDNDVNQSDNNVSDSESNTDLNTIIESEEDKESNANSESNTSSNTDTNVDSISNDESNSNSESEQNIDI